MYIFMLEGTLADHSHRLGSQRGHGRASVSDFLEDRPIRPSISLMEALVTSGVDVEIWSTRPEGLRAGTEQWLQQHCPLLRLSLSGVELKFRPDHCCLVTDKDLVNFWIDELLADGTERESVLAFDSLPTTKHVWRYRGIPSLNRGELS